MVRLAAVPAVLSRSFDGEDDHAMTTCCSSAKTDGTGQTAARKKSALIVTPRARVFSEQYQGRMLRSVKNGTPFEGLEEIVFEKRLTSSPKGWRNEP
jgi:hypothetical protein